MEDHREAVHRTIVVVDVEGFGDRRRTNRHQVAVRRGLYRALQEAFTESRIPWAACDHEDRGDGVFILVPPEVPKGVFAEALPLALVGALQAHNGTHPVQEWIRLRMAVHAGEVTYDEHGVTAATAHQGRKQDVVPEAGHGEQLGDPLDEATIPASKNVRCVNAGPFAMGSSYCLPPARGRGPAPSYGTVCTALARQSSGISRAEGTAAHVAALGRSSLPGNRMLLVFEWRLHVPSLAP